MRVISDRSALFLGGMLFDVANTRIYLVVFKMMSKCAKSCGVNKLGVSKKGSYKQIQGVLFIICCVRFAKLPFLVQFFSLTHQLSSQDNEQSFEI